MVLGLDARFKFDEMMWAIEALDSMKVSTGRVVSSALTSAFGDDVYSRIPAEQGPGRFVNNHDVVRVRFHIPPKRELGDPRCEDRCEDGSRHWQGNQTGDGLI